MIKATRTPTTVLACDEKICLRCGIVWRDSRYRYVDRAPCGDCREILADEGEDIVDLYVKPEKRQPSTAGVRQRFGQKVAA